ncbi:ABC transporter permease [Nocardioides sp. L-11A]|uniref:ABC transporter permease n=1 Tax=Nocardioides sp. L-11A TaxID=3043848 RepID=UPI00249B786A|nr:ABC transporter permease [Nocardioides sp. L-11A]
MSTPLNDKAAASARPMPDAGTPPAHVDHDRPGRPKAAARGLWRFMTSSMAAFTGTTIVLAFVVVGALADVLVRTDPLQVFGSDLLHPPSAEHWFGTDGNGMDVFARTIHAIQIDLVISVTAVVISIVVGVALGLIAGYRGGWFEMVLLRVMDVLQAFPALILALAVVAASQESIAAVIFVIALLDIPVFIRMTRGQVLSLRDAMYVEAARATGNKPWRIMWRHIMPNTLPPLIIQTAVRLAWSVMIVSSLAFVGVGIQVPTPEWGAMIRHGSAYVTSGQWWPSVFPGLALMLLVLGFNLLADAIQDHLDPRKD